MSWGKSESRRGLRTADWSSGAGTPRGILASIYPNLDMIKSNQLAINNKDCLWRRWIVVECFKCFKGFKASKYVMSGIMSSGLAEDWERVVFVCKLNVSGCWFVCFLEWRKWKRRCRWTGSLRSQCLGHLSRGGRMKMKARLPILNLKFPWHSGANSWRSRWMVSEVSGSGVE